MQKLSLKICLFFLVFLANVALGADANDKKPDLSKPLTYEQMKKISSATLMMRMNTSAEQDYMAGKVAMDRMEVVEATELFGRAARKGHTGAMVEYGNLLNRAGFIEDAVASYRKAAMLGDADAQFTLGSMFLDIGNYDWTDLDTKLRPIEARKWIAMAAAQGHKDAINLMAMAYSDGGLGLTEAEKTNEDILKWLNKAAENGNGPSMDKLSQAYRKGLYGLEADDAKADEWAKKAQAVYGNKEQKEVKAKRKKRL